MSWSGPNTDWHQGGKFGVTHRTIFLMVVLPGTGALVIYVVEAVARALQVEVGVPWKRATHPGHVLPSRDA